jgi:periplasmic protein TonB
MPTLLEPLETAEYEVKPLPLETSAETQPPVVLDVPNFEVPIFAEMLLETTTAQRRRRKLAAVLSFGFQGILLCILLAVPILITEDLPKAQWLTFLVAPPPPPPPAPPAAVPAARVVRKLQSQVLETGGLRAPGSIPKKVQMIHEEEAPPPLADAMGGVVGGVPGGIPGRQLGGVIGGIVSASANVAAIPKLAAPVAPKRVRISQGVTKGYLVKQTEPHYPLLAKQARIQGEVVLQAIISKNGDVANLQVVSGHPFLAPAALEAVQQWHYRPFLLNGQPVEVETTVTVSFRLVS